MRGVRRKAKSEQAGVVRGRAGSERRPTIRGAAWVQRCAGGDVAGVMGPPHAGMRRAGRATRALPESNGRAGLLPAPRRRDDCTSAVLRRAGGRRMRNRGRACGRRRRATAGPSARVTARGGCRRLRGAAARDFRGTEAAERGRRGFDWRRRRGHGAFRSRRHRRHHRCGSRQHGGLGIDGWRAWRRGKRHCCSCERSAGFHRDFGSRRQRRN